MALLTLLAGCGGNKSPSGPGGAIPPFTVSLLPPAITPGNPDSSTALVMLVVTFPNDFNQLDARQTYFSSSQGGFLQPDSSRIAVQNIASGYLNPAVWYSYSGQQQEFVDTVKVEVVDLAGNTIAWNYGLIRVH
jgi:hypothetical protein